MSYITVRHEVRIDSDQLLNLFLGRGNLVIPLDDQNVTIEEIHGRYLQCEEDGVETHNFEIRGVSDDSNVNMVDGTGTLTAFNGNKAITLSFELHLQDRYD